MLSLILFRHGKSDWEVPYGTDHERPLANRGKEAARCMGRMLRQAGQIPDLAVSSSATRARDTLQLAVRAGHWDCRMLIDSALYDTTPQAVLNWVNGLEENPASLLLTGHEPTWSEMAGALIGGAALRVPTAAMLRIDFEIETWQQLDFGHGQLRWLLLPKLICKPKGHR